MKKKFIITIDTEGDNLWDLSKKITTENAKYIPRFQELCEKYDFYPVWLTNYEMALDPYFVHYIKSKVAEKKCEIGMHLHAWNNPPFYELEKINKNRDYLIEYSYEVMEEKIKVIHDLLQINFDSEIVSHRSGRWATDDRYLSLLYKFGYKIDCSVTPHINWYNNLGVTGLRGTDYSSSPEEPHFIYEDLLEVPMTIRRVRNFQYERVNSVKDVLKEIKRFTLGRTEWLRPNRNLDLKSLIALSDTIFNSRSDYLMFMLHSSELMPGGSPSFTSEREVDLLYECLEKLFYHISQNFEGVTLKDYHDEKVKELL